MSALPANRGPDTRGSPARLRPPWPAFEIDQWNWAKKATLVSVTVVGLVLYATFLLEYAGAHLEEVPFIDPAVLVLQLRLSYVVLGLWTVLGLISFTMQRRHGNLSFFKHAPVQLFSISNALFAYLLGPVTVPYGPVVMIGGTLASLPLFGRRATLLGLASWLVVAVPLGVLEQLRVLPYGPLFRANPVVDGHLPGLWLAGIGSITIMGIALCAGVSVLAINQLQARGRRLRSSQLELLATVEELGQTHDALRRSHEDLEARVEARTLELRVTVAELEAANGLKSEFVATMSHELRTPLSVILGYSDLLRDGAFGNLTVDQDDTLNRLTRSATQLFDLVNATLDLSRLEAGTMDLDLQDVAVARLVSEVIETQEKPTTNVEFRCQEVTTLGSIRTDAGKLKVVLRNLLANAFKFTESGSITLSATALRSGIEFSVRDTGPGIAREMHEAVFEPFRQGDGSPSRLYGGAGLGLHIVRQLAEMLGGDVSLTSELGKGATFRVWVPTSGPAARPFQDPTVASAISSSK